MTLVALPALPRKSKSRRTCVIPASKSRLVFVVKNPARAAKPRLLPSSFLFTGARHAHSRAVSCPSPAAVIILPFDRRVRRHQPACLAAIHARKRGHQRILQKRRREVEVLAILAGPHTAAVGEDAGARRRQAAVLRHACQDLRLKGYCGRHHVARDGYVVRSESIDASGSGADRQLAQASLHIQRQHPSAHAAQHSLCG